jgi:tetratricopeptide (TPR) repeat protein
MVAAARIFSAANRRDRAIETIGRAIARNPGWFEHYMARANFRSWDDFHGRRQDLETALRLNPGNLEVEARLAELSLEQGKWGDAVTHFSTVLAKEPRDYGLLAGRSAAYRKAGNEALAALDHAAALSASEGAGDFSTLCWVYAAYDAALDWALDACDRALALDPDRYTALANRGMVKLRLGRLDEALADYSAAIAADKRQANPWYGRALVHFRKGDKAAADADRKTALTLDPRVREAFEPYGFKDF